MSWRAISRWLFGSGEARVRPAGGGCINDAAVLEVPGKAPLFVKRNAATQLPMFEAEAFGLRVLRDAGAIRVPEPVAFGTEGGSAFLALEFLPLGGARTPEREREMGRQVARLHRCAGSGGRFGFPIDNRIGEAPQRNAWRDSWVGFYRECRLRPQIAWAEEKGLRIRGAEELMARLGEFFRGYDPAPSLLHGDLWGGNAAFTEAGEPAIFDPAPYFGDREADLAFTEMFGGFGPAFYQGYAAEWKPDPGYAARRDLYNLYHTLNHHHHFGGGYGAQAAAMVARLLGAIGSSG